MPVGSSKSLPGLSLPSSLYYFKETKCWRDKMLLIPHHIQALTTSVVAAVLLLAALLLFLAIKLLFTAHDSRPVDVESGSARGKRRRKCQNPKIRTSPKPKTKQSPNRNIPPVHRDAKSHVAFSRPRGYKEKRRDLREDGDLSSGGSGYFSRSSDDEALPSKKAASSSATRKSKVIKPSHKRPGPFKTRVLEERKEMPAEETESRLPSPIVDGRDLNLSNRQEELISSITDNSHSYPSECVYDFTSKQSQSKFFAIPSENGPRSMQGGKRKNDVESQLGKNFQPIKPKKRVPGKSRNTAIDRTADHELLHVTPVREMQRIVNKDCEVTEPFPPSEIAESEADNGLRSRTENTIHPNNNPVSLLSLGSKPTDDTLAKQDNERNNRIQALLNETKRLQEMWERRKAAEEIARDDEEEQTQEESTEHEIPSSETIPHIPANEHELSPSNGTTPTETLAGERPAEINQMSGLPSKTDRTNQPKDVESQPQPSDFTVASTDHSQLGFEAPMHLTAHYDRSFSDVPPTTSQICLSTPAEYSPLRSIRDQPSETGYHGQPSESLPSYTPHSSQFNYDTMSKMSFFLTSQSGNRSESLHTPPVPPPFPKEIVSGTHDQQQTSETSEAHSFNLTSFQAKTSPHPSAIVPQKPPQLRSNGETLLNPSMPFCHSPISDTVSHHQLPELSGSNMSPSFHKSISDSYAVPFISTPTPDAEEFENKQTDYFQQIGNNEEAVGELSEKFRPPEAEAGHVIDEPQREYQRPGSELSEERDQSSEERDQSSEERDQSSGERDQSSEVRDQSSEERDQSREERDQSSEERDQSHVEQTVHTSVPTGGLKDEAHYQDERRELQELQGDVEETHFSTDVVQEKFPNVQPEASRRKEGKEKTKEAVLKEIEDTVRAVSRGSEGDSVTEGVEKHEDKAKEKEGLGLEESRKEEETVKLKNVHENESIDTENKTGATAPEKDSQRVMDLQDELVEADAKIRDSGNSEQREEIETRSQSGRENEKESEEETKQPKTAKKEIVEENEGQEKGMTGLGSQEVKEEGTESLEKVSEKESSDRESKTAEKALKEDSERGDKVRDAETREQTEEMETSSPQLVEGKVDVPEEEIKQAKIVGRVEVADKEQDEQGDVKTDQDKEISEGSSETGQNIPEEDTMSVKKQKEVVETNVNTGGIERDKKTTPSKLEKVRDIFSPGKIKEKILKKESTRPEEAGDEDISSRASKGESGIPSLVVGEEHQEGEEKTHLETVSEEKKKEDVKQSTWKSSVLSLKSVLKEPHSFKHVIFDQKASLFYDVKGKWEKLGYGNLTISVDEKKKAELEFLDGVEQIARHPVRKETQLVPAKGTDRAYVWTTEAHIKGEKKVQKKTLFVRFRDADTANQFQEEFRNAQSEEKLAEMLKSRRRQSGGDAVSLPESIPEEQQAPEVEGDKNRAEKEGEGDQIRVEASKNAGGDQRGKIKEDASDEPEEMKIKIDEAEKSRDIGEKATEGTEIIGKEDYKSDTPSKDKSAVEGTPLGESKEREELGETPETKLEEEDVSEVNPPVAQEQQKLRDGGEDGKTDIPVAEKSVGGGKEDRGADSQEAETDDGDEVILTAEVELFYDRDGKWDKQGSGVIKIVSLSKDGAYQVRMKKGDTFIANHRVKKETKLVPAKGSDRCYVWTTDNSFSVGKPKKTTFFARFKTYSDAESFRRHFEEGQAKKKKETPLKSKLGKEKR